MRTRGKKVVPQQHASNKLNSMHTPQYNQSSSSIKQLRDLFAQSEHVKNITDESKDPDQENGKQADEIQDLEIHTNCKSGSHANCDHQSSGATIESQNVNDINQSEPLITCRGGGEQIKQQVYGITRSSLQEESSFLKPSPTHQVIGLRLAAEIPNQQALIYNKINAQSNSNGKKNHSGNFSRAQPGNRFNNQHKNSSKSQTLSHQKAKQTHSKQISTNSKAIIKNHNHQQLQKSQQNSNSKSNPGHQNSSSAKPNKTLQMKKTLKSGDQNDQRKSQNHNNNNNVKLSNEDKKAVDSLFSFICSTHLTQSRASSRHHEPTKQQQPLQQQYQNKQAMEMNKTSQIESLYEEWIQGLNISELDETQLQLAEGFINLVQSGRATKPQIDQYLTLLLESGAIDMQVKQFLEELCYQSMVGLISLQNQDSQLINQQHQLDSNDSQNFHSYDQEMIQQMYNEQLAVGFHNALNVNNLQQAQELAGLIKLCYEKIYQVVLQQIASNNLQVDPEIIQKIQVIQCLQNQKVEDLPSDQQGQYLMIIQQLMISVIQLYHDQPSHKDHMTIQLLQHLQENTLLDPNSMTNLPPIMNEANQLVNSQQSQQKPHNFLNYKRNSYHVGIAYHILKKNYEQREAAKMQQQQNEQEIILAQQQQHQLEDELQQDQLQLDQQHQKDAEMIQQIDLDSQEPQPHSQQLEESKQSEEQDYILIEDDTEMQNACDIQHQIGGNEEDEQMNDQTNHQKESREASQKNSQDSSPLKQQKKPDHTETQIIIQSKPLDESQQQQSHSSLTGSQQNVTASTNNQSDLLSQIQPLIQNVNSHNTIIINQNHYYITNNYSSANNSTVIQGNNQSEQSQKSKSPNDSKNPSSIQKQ
eukprot:403330719